MITKRDELQYINVADLKRALIEEYNLWPESFDAIEACCIVDSIPHYDRKEILTYGEKTT